MERLSNLWAPGLDPRTAALTVIALLMAGGVAWAVFHVIRWILNLIILCRSVYFVLGMIERDVKTTRAMVDRIQFQLNRDVDSKPRVSIPPPLDLSPPTVDATDWVDDDKKTSHHLPSTGRSVILDPDR
jgi:hypothetical protein